MMEQTIPHSAMPLSWGRMVLGYLAGCAIGALAVWAFMQAMTPQIHWLRELLVVFGATLVICLPTFMLGRWYMARNQFGTWKHHAALWACAGTLPVFLIAAPILFELVVFFAPITLVGGAVAGVVAYLIENKGTT